MAKVKSHLIQGKALYCKIIGAPVPGYDEDSLEWTFDLVLDKDQEKELLASGVSPRYIKDHKTTGERYVRFTRKAIKKDGTKGTPINVIDAQGHPWDDRLIGNGSVLNVAYTNNTVGKGKEARNKPSVLSVQVWDWVKYQPKSQFPTKPVDPEPGAQEDGSVSDGDASGPLKQDW